MKSKIITVSENKHYEEIDGIRLIYENNELTGWYNPNPKVGEWVKNKEYMTLEPNENNEFSLLNHYECSLCGWEVSSETDITFNYCPDCGAKMLESEVNQ